MKSIKKHPPPPPVSSLIILDTYFTLQNYFQNNYDITFSLLCVSYMKTYFFLSESSLVYGNNSVNNRDITSSIPEAASVLENSAHVCLMYKKNL